MATNIRVSSIHFNWFYTSGVGEEYQQFVVGDFYDMTRNRTEKKVTEIIHHMPCSGEGHYCEVLFDDGSRESVYNLNRVFYETF